MIVDIDTNQPEIAELVAGVKECKIALPEFQREFVWDPDDVAALLVSIARGWPTGTFLLLTGEQVTKFQAKPVEKAPPISKESLETLVLDGQQRLTGLYHAYENHSPYVYYLELGKVRDQESIDDDSIKAERRTRFDKTYSDLQQEADNRIIPIHRIIDDEKFQDWINFLPENERSGWFGTRNTLLPGLKSYRIPSVKLSRDVPLEAIAKIFETINNTGQSLTTFDLMVARLYPHEFKLKDQWRDACERYPKSMTEPDTVPKKDQGDRISGLDVLKLIALWEALKPKVRGPKDNPTGVRESDVLKLEPQVVIENWDRALVSLDRAFRFVQEHCGVVRWNLLPSKAMLYPLADALSRGEPDDKLAAKLERWYWGVAVHSHYASGTATQPVTDATALRQWAADEAKVPEAVSAPGKESFLEQLLEPRPRKVLQRAIASLICSLSAKDWLTKTKLMDTDPNQRIELHHVFPTKYIEDRSGISNVAANLTPVLGSTNKSLRNDPPPQVVDSTSIDLHSITTHLIDIEAYGRGDYEAFTSARANAIFEAFRDKLDGGVTA